MRVFGLDGDYLRAVADRIGASTAAELAIAPDPATLPPNDGNGFIGQSGPRPPEPERFARGATARADRRAHRRAEVAQPTRVATGSGSPIRSYTSAIEPEKKRSCTSVPTPASSKWLRYHDTASASSPSGCG